MALQSDKGAPLVAPVAPAPPQAAAPTAAEAAERERERKEKKKDKKDKAKKHKQEVKKQGTANPDETHRQTAELELLIGDKNNGNIVGTFKADTKDKRF